ncbi:serine O-acetyltransferase [Pyruvatibacter mobilis]|uniref:serine O-acetyltransferase n=1 Tax=Pyruvatibacter mobilis TaxID=1712261 RepID=UPI003BACF919
MNDMPSTKGPAAWPRQRLVGLQNFAHRLNRYAITRPLARLIELVIRLVYGAYMPAAATIHRSVHFGHNGLAVVVNRAAIIEEGCFVGSHVVLGGRAPHPGAPRLEPGAAIHTGAKVLGPITIGRNAVVAPNAVVLEDVAPCHLVGGVPARILREGDQ